MMIPGWVMAIPIIVGGLSSFYAIFRYAKTDRARNLGLLGMIAGLVLYYLAISPFEVPPAEPPAPETTPGVQVTSSVVPV